MTSRLAKRRAPESDDKLISTLLSVSAREEDKTIPFLRRLCDMLQENDDVISFYPGCHKNGPDLLGRIVVHDRARVESEVLPRYFNHASFASLRRQLNYFSFTRIGKGRQRGATYCNDAVIEIGDILRLKRRAIGTNTGTTITPNSIPREKKVHLVGSSNSSASNSTNDDHPKSAFMKANQSSGTNRSSGINNMIVPVLHFSVSQDSGVKSSFRPIKRTKHRESLKTNDAQIISPSSISPVSSGDEASLKQEEQHVFLDLTVPSNKAPSLPDYKSGIQVQGSVHEIKMSPRDDDILAGCNALLSFSSGFA